MIGQCDSIRGDLVQYSLGQLGRCAVSCAGRAQSLAVLNSIMLVTVAVATAREANYERRELWVVALALFTPPIFMVMWDGQIDGLALLGLFGLPWLVPFALVRPHLTIWAILSRRNWTLGAVIFGALTLMVWGWWLPTF